LLTRQLGLTGGEFCTGGTPVWQERQVLTGCCGVGSDGGVGSEGVPLVVGGVGVPLVVGVEDVDGGGASTGGAATGGVVSGAFGGSDTI
jgi:hypothetical protein